VNEGISPFAVVGVTERGRGYAIDSRGDWICNPNSFIVACTCNQHWAAHLLLTMPGSGSLSPPRANGGLPWTARSNETVIPTALIVLDFAVLEIVAADLSFFMMPQYGTQFKTCYQILPSCPKASLLGMEHFAHGGQISSNWTVQKRKRRSGLCLTASASYYYRRFDRTLVRPDEDATLRKCLQFLRVLIVLRPDGCREDAKTA
jgi:hypothetical protein